MATTFGFIGAGNMGGALASAVCKKTGANNVYVSCLTEEETITAAKKYGCNASSNEKIAEECDYIFLGVKPQYMQETLMPIKDILSNRETKPVLVSMAAGLNTVQIGAFSGDKCPVIRIMPNTPAAVGKGVIQVCKNSLTSDEQYTLLCDALSEAGLVEDINEALIDAASAVSGCGPAFVYMFIESLADGAVECGLPRDKAMRFAAETVRGAAELLLSGNKHPGELKDAVCSPGGSTIAGVHALEDGKFRSSVIDAVTAAYKRTKELGKK